MPKYNTTVSCEVDGNPELRFAIDLKEQSAEQAVENGKTATEMIQAFVEVCEEHSADEVPNLSDRI